MITCPTCKARLARGKTKYGVVHACPNCGGRMMNVSVLRRSRVAREFLNDVWQRARGLKTRTGRPCSYCQAPMALVSMPTANGHLTLDVCVGCSCIWFDAGEYTSAPRQDASAEADEAVTVEDGPAGAPPSATPAAPKPPPASKHPAPLRRASLLESLLDAHAVTANASKRGAVGAAAVPPREPSPRSITLAIRPSQMPANAPTSARPAASVPTAAAVARPAPVVPEIRIAPEVRRPAKIDPVRPPADYGRSQYATTGSKGHDEPSIGEYLAGVLGLPVEDRNARDSEVAKTRPWGTYALAAILVAVAYFGRNSVERMIEMWGFVPAQWHRLGLFTAATCFFIHAGFIHVLGNVYFLATFGDDVEDHLGRSRFLWLVAVAHLVGIIAHGWFDARPDVPLVGASAGISGVIAFYAVSFPRARLRLFAIVTWVRLGAFKAFMLWVGLQAVMAVAQAGGLTSVSAYAHLGGAAVGMLGGALLQKQRRDAFRPDERKLDSGRPERHAIEQRRVYVPSAGYLSTPAQVRSVWHEYLDSKRPT